MQQQPAQPLVEAIRAQGGRVTACALGLGIADNIPKLIDMREAELGPIDVLVSNHTHSVMETFDPARASDKVGLVTAGEIDAHFSVNARSYALMTTEYLKRFLERGAESGRIISVSTYAAHAYVANVSYAPSKHAIESYSRSAAELENYFITINNVAPGPIQTGCIRPAIAADVAEGTPLFRVGEPEDVADLVVFLASYQARWVTGELICVRGGWRMSR
jgi:3-oxoacyl-[acyl-carrier protein] reductase